MTDSINYRAGTVHLAIPYLLHGHLLSDLRTRIHAMRVCGNLLGEVEVVFWPRATVPFGAVALRATR